MNSYQYVVSLRVFHPTLDPEQITDTLGFAPHTTARAGDDRKTKTGDPLSGTYRQSYWSSRISGPARMSSDELSLDDYIQEKNLEIAVHADYFRQVVESGGEVQYFVGVFGWPQIGLYFDPGLLKHCAQLNIAIALDIYAQHDEAT